ncbi:MAG: LiaI-LiaF-like domain-containing protein, partial [Heyndrickxia sp.]
MKNQKVFAGIILLGFGFYFYLSQNHLELFKEYITWPSLLIIIGIAFLVQGYNGKNYEAILP